MDAASRNEADKACMHLRLQPVQDHGVSSSYAAGARRTTAAVRALHTRHCVPDCSAGQQQDCLMGSLN